MKDLVEFLERLGPALKNYALAPDSAALAGIIQNAEYWAEWAREQAGVGPNYLDMRKAARASDDD